VNAWVVGMVGERVGYADAADAADAADDVGDYDTADG